MLVSDSDGIVLRTKMNEFEEVWPDDFIRYKRSQGWAEWAIEKMVYDAETKGSNGAKLRVRKVDILPDGRMDRANAAVYLGLSYGTLKNWPKRGWGPPYVRLGHKAFYYKDDLDWWIEKQRDRNHEPLR